MASASQLNPQPDIDEWLRREDAFIASLEAEERQDRKRRYKAQSDSIKSSEWADDAAFTTKVTELIGADPDIGFNGSSVRFDDYGGDPMIELLEEILQGNEVTSIDEIPKAERQDFLLQLLDEMLADAVPEVGS